MQTLGRFSGIAVNCVPPRRRWRRRHVRVRACSSIGTIESETAKTETKTHETARVAVLGASGYTGAEVTRLLAQHPKFKITAMTADRQAGRSYAEVFPHLITMPKIPDLIKIEELDFDHVDCVFCCLPHGKTQSVIAEIPERVKVVDLSADFRLRDPLLYEEWYGSQHAALELQEEAVYGLTEVHRNQIKNSRLVANPGCYPTSSLLPLIPLLRADLIDNLSIIIDSKSGVSGAGRAPNESKLFCEVTEGLHAYGVSQHRHTPEIEQELSDAAGVPPAHFSLFFIFAPLGMDVSVTFTPHLIPMSRGMLSTIYVKPVEGVDSNALRTAIDNFYADEKFVKVLDEGVIPHTHHVRGSNFNLINVFDGAVTGQAVILSVIDNLVKGASGQALQNMNLLMGVEESCGLLQQPLFP